MSIVENRPQIEGVPEGDHLDADPGSRGMLVDDTTELRWIAEGRLPSDIEEWFTRGGTMGVVEERCDTYRMDGRSDRGVKLRFRTTLESKVCQAVGQTLTLGAGLAGRLQKWRRWSPAEAVVDIGCDAPWLDVCKVVTKRRISVDGLEIVSSHGERGLAGAGCDVEIAAITAGDVEAWTFAFAAFGPTAGHEDAILTAWQALTVDGLCPADLAAAIGPSSSYPEWLLSVASQGGTSHTRAFAAT